MEGRFLFVGMAGKKIKNYQKVYFLTVENIRAICTSPCSVLLRICTKIDTIFTYFEKCQKVTVFRGIEWLFKGGIYTADSMKGI